MGRRDGCAKKSIRRGTSIKSARNAREALGNERGSQRRRRGMSRTMTMTTIPIIYPAISARAAGKIAPRGDSLPANFVILRRPPPPPPSFSPASGGIPSVASRFPRARNFSARSFVYVTSRELPATSGKSTAHSARMAEGPARASDYRVSWLLVKVHRSRDPRAPCTLTGLHEIVGICLGYDRFSSVPPPPARSSAVA